MQEMWVGSLGQEDPLEEGMATHSSILAWRIPWTESLAGCSSGATKSWTRLEATEHRGTQLSILCLWATGTKAFIPCPQSKHEFLSEQNKR